MRGVWHISVNSACSFYRKRLIYFWQGANRSSRRLKVECKNRKDINEIEGIRDTSGGSVLILCSRDYWYWAGFVGVIYQAVGVNVVLISEVVLILVTVHIIMVRLLRHNVHLVLHFLFLLILSICLSACHCLLFVCLWAICCLIQIYWWWRLSWAPAGRCKGVHVQRAPPGFWLKNFLQRCAIAVIKINAGNAGIKSHNTEV